MTLPAFFGVGHADFHLWDASANAAAWSICCDCGYTVSVCRLNGDERKLTAMFLFVQLCVECRHRSLAVYLHDRYYTEVGHVEDCVLVDVEL